GGGAGAAVAGSGSGGRGGGGGGRADYHSLCFSSSSGSAGGVATPHSSLSAVSPFVNLLDGEDDDHDHDHDHDDSAGGPVMS
ncbi:unnamed protein product, partial [Scytosiphon promiscuus]